MPIDITQAVEKVHPYTFLDNYLTRKWMVFGWCRVREDLSGCDCVAQLPIGVSTIRQKVAGRLALPHEVGHAKFIEELVEADPGFDWEGFQHLAKNHLPYLEVDAWLRAIDSDTRIITNDSAAFIMDVLWSYFKVAGLSEDPEADLLDVKEQLKIRSSGAKAITKFIDDYRPEEPPPDEGGAGGGIGGIQIVDEDGNVIAEFRPGDPGEGEGDGEGEEGEDGGDGKGKGKGNGKGKGEPEVGKEEVREDGGKGGARDAHEGTGEDINEGHRGGGTVKWDVDSERWDKLTQPDAINAAMAGNFDDWCRKNNIDPTRKGLPPVIESLLS